MRQVGLGGVRFSDPDEYDKINVRYQTPYMVLNVAMHFGVLLDEERAEVFESRAREYLLEELAELPDDWRQIMTEHLDNENNVTLVSLAIALGMCTHPEQQHSV